MPVVLVHGNPETAAIWDDLRAALDRTDVRALSPPGFGTPAPDGFAATGDAYRDWLIAELTSIGEPVDLVGHDWGGGHTIRAAMERPELLRSWCADIAGVFHTDYVWHPAAQRYQGPHGEEAVRRLMALDTQPYVTWLTAMGMSDEAARSCAEARGEEMGRCILALYRSAAQPAMGALGGELDKASARPGLVIVARDDHYVGSPRLAREAAQRAGAQVLELDGLGHGWMCQDPQRGARVLSEFWASIDDSIG